MSQIMKTTSIAAGAVNDNVVQGSAFEFAKTNQVVSIGIGQSATGMFTTVQTGSVVMCEEFEPPILTRYPIIPDEMYFSGVMAAADRLVIRVRNPTGGALTARTVVQAQAIR